VLAHEIGHVDTAILSSRSSRNLGLYGAIHGKWRQGCAHARDHGERFCERAVHPRAGTRADQYGLRLLADSHINPSNFAGSWRTRAGHCRGKKDRPEIEYFSTHPDVRARIDSAYAAAKRFDVKTEKRFNIDWRNVKRRLPSVFDGN